jgi:methylase of polypeptide subunit release factors
VTPARAAKTRRLKRHGPGVSGLTLLSSPKRVMRPRATSEQLIAAARAHVGDGVTRVVDVGTGRGAIAIAVASSCPHAEIEAAFSHRDGLELDPR